MHGKFDDLGRFADPSLLILTSLADGAEHSAIMTTSPLQRGDDGAGHPVRGAVAAGAARWVRPPDSEERRKPYEITAAGQQVLGEQLASMQQIVRVGFQRTGIPRTASAWGT